MMVFEAVYKNTVLPEIIEAQSWTEALRITFNNANLLESLKRRR